MRATGEVYSGFPCTLRWGWPDRGRHGKQRQVCGRLVRSMRLQTSGDRGPQGLSRRTRGRPSLALLAKEVASQSLPSAGPGALFPPAMPVQPPPPPTVVWLWLS